MSWYNSNNKNSIIDATQQLTGGSTTTTSIVTNVEDLDIDEDTPDTGEATTADNVLLPAVFNEETGTYDLYIRNVNQGGRIFLTTRGDGEQVKIDDGKLFVYYYYNPIISLIIPSGWTNVADYLVANRQGINNNSAALVSLGGVIGAIELDLNTTIRPLVIEHTAALTTISIDINTIKTRLNLSSSTQGREDLSDTILTVESISNDVARSYFNNLGTYTIFNAFRQLSKSRTGLLISGVVAIAFGGYVGASLAVLGYIYDFFRIEEIEEEIKILQQVSYNIETHTDKNVADKLDVYGLAINQLTNTGGLTDGVYEIQSQNSNGDNSLIEITVLSGLASITNVLEVGSGYSVNDVINIPKIELGGSSGNLEINVNQVFSSLDLVSVEVDSKITELNEIKNRQRRRQFIPDKNNFGNGLNIVENDITEPSGEITKDLDISLKIDDSQFEYDATGNLQLTNYSQISQNTLRISSNIINISQLNNKVGNNTNPKTGLYALIDAVDIKADNNTCNIAGLQTNLNNTNANVATNGIQIANNASNIIELQGLVSGTTGNVNDVWEIILPDGTNYITNTSYKMDLGYKEQFAGFPINLITLAYKTTPTILNTDETGLDILGFYPSLERIDDADNIELVKTIGLNINNDYSFEKGLLYLDNTDPLIDYDLSRNVEIIIFLRPYDLSSTTEEYYILQTGIELAPDEYDIDNNKLRIGIKDNKLQITHNVKRTFQYYPVDFANDIRSTQTAGLSYVSTSTDSTIQLVYTDVASREYFFGVDDLNEVNNLIKAQQIDAVTDYFTSIYYFDMFFNEILPQGYSTTVWTSPKHYYEEDPFDTSTQNIGAIRLHFEYMVMDTPTSLAIDSFTSTADLQNSLELQLRINVKQRGSNTILHTRTYDFNQIEYSITTGTNAYTQTFYVPAVYPELAGSTRYSRIEFELVHKGTGYTPLPIGTQGYKFYTGQHAIRIYHIEYFKYSNTLTTFYDHTPVTFQSINPIPVFPTPIQFNDWHKLVINMRLDNKILNYYVNDVYYMFSFISELINIQLQAPNLDPQAGFFFTAQYEFTNANQNTLTRDNNILIFGNQPSQGALHFTHFNYRFLQLETTPYFNQTQRDKLDELINYNFYHESVEVPRYLKCKEFYGDVCEFRKILNNGISLYQELPPEEQTQLLSNTSSDNVLSANFNVPINNLYSLTTDNAGYLHYNNTTKSVELLKNAIDLNALSATSLRMNDKEQLIFEHVIDGSSFSVRVASRSRTSLSEFERLNDFEGNYVGTRRLNYLDPPYPTHIYTLTETQITRNLPALINQYETWNSGQLQDPALNPYNPNGFSPIQFFFRGISGDVIKFKCDPSANGLWGLYYADYATLNPTDATVNVIPTFSDLTLIKLMNNGDDFLVDARKYKFPFYEVYFVYNQDITKTILLSQYYPEAYIDSILTGTVLELNSYTNVAKNENPMRFEFNAFGALKGCRLTIKADERPVFTTGKIVTTNGRPAVPNDFYKFDFAVNFSTFAQFYESGDLITTGNIYVDADINAIGSLDLPILVNRIDNLKSPQEFAITGLPPLADQVFHFVIESFDLANRTIYFTGTDRANTYNNQYVNQFELYFDDVLKITLSPVALFQYNENPLTINFGISRPYPLSTLNLVTLVNSNPQQLYIRMEKRGDSVYQVFELYEEPRQIILSNVVDYVNDAFLPTDVFALEYLPYSNTYRWKENYIVDSEPQPVGTGQTLSVPTGKFSVRESTNEISSRRTLSSAVPIEKVSQVTTYNVFNGEVEFNNNVILENVNTDIGVLFTIYTNKNKRDPITQVDNFKDKSSIILDDGSHEWIFLRDPLNLDDEFYSTLFKHGADDILRLKYNEVICYKELNVSSDGIKFSDNTILTSTSQIITNTANITSLQSTISTNDLNSSNYTFSVQEKADSNESQISMLTNTAIVQAGLIQDNANDIIQLQTDTTANTSSISNNSTNISTLQSQVTGLLSPSAVSVPLTYDAGIYQSTYTKVVPIFNSSFTPYYTTSGITIDYTNNRLVINTTGTYRISYNLNFRNKRSVRSIIVSALYKNGSILGGSENQSSYLRFFNWTSSNSISFISQLNSGDYLELYTYGYGDSGGGYVELLGGASIITLDQIA